MVVVVVVVVLNDALLPIFEEIYSNYEAVVAVSMGLSDDTGYDSIRLPFDKIAKIF